MSILLIDTSGAYSTVAVAQDGDLLGFGTLKGRPAARIHEQIRTLLPPVGITLPDVDTIGVITGPGSWTGLNIGVTAAKTLALVLKKPLIPIATLDALVAPHSWTQGPVCAIMNAGRGRYYSASYASNGQGQLDLQSGHLTVSGIEALMESLLLEEGTPLVVEYGSTFGELVSHCAGAICHKSQVRLWPDGIVAAALQSTPLHREKIMSLTPTYLQATLAERNANL